MKRRFVTLALFVLVATPALAGTKPLAPRRVVELDGTWQVEQGGMDAAPQEFSNTVVVPGLVDMALTEFWRCHRECAGVLHFCGLGYSRSGLKERPEGGATSDHFVDLERLVLEPYFEECVREAFNPVGLLLDFWAEELPPGGERAMDVVVINDLDRPWRGAVRLRVLREGRVVGERQQDCEVAPLGRQVLAFEPAIPEDRGEYTLAAELTDGEGNRVRSLRDFRVRAER